MRKPTFVASLVEVNPNTAMFLVAIVDVSLIKFDEKSSRILLLPFSNECIDFDLIQLHFFTIITNNAMPNECIDGDFVIEIIYLRPIF